MKFLSLWSKALIAFLTVLMVAQPFAPIFAEDFGSADIFEQSLPAESEVAPEEDSNPSDIPADIAEGELAPKEDLILPLATADEQSSNLPEAPVSYKLQTQVDLKSGALTFDYPIIAPAGRNGFGPNIKLSYNSQNADTDNIAGYGWTISGIPEISRLNKAGLGQLYSADQAKWHLNSTLSGEIVNAGENTFKAKIEGGDFLSYQFIPSNSSFTATDKSGATYIFGADSSSRQDNPDDPSQIYRWLASSIIDSNGNTINFTYAKDQGQIYPDTISYGEIYRIKFIKKQRADIIENYKRGFLSATRNIISEIDVFVSGAISKKYILNYSAGANKTRSLLSSAQMEGEPPTVFSYQSSSLDRWSAAPEYKFPNPPGDLSTRWLGRAPEDPYADLFFEGADPVFVDLNGDGLQDLITILTPEYGNVGNYPCYRYKEARIFLNLGNSWSGLSSVWVLPDNSDWKLNLNRGGLAWPYFVNLNGDSLPDLVEWVGETFMTPKLDYVYLNSGAGWTRASGTWSLPEPLKKITQDGSEGHLMYKYSQIHFTDLNGDGLSDFFGVARYTQESGNYSFFQNFTYFNTGTGWADAGSSWDLVNIDPWFDEWHSNNSNPSFSLNFLDINGDGLADMMAKVEEGSGANPYSLYLNTGTGWAKDPLWNVPTPEHVQYFSDIVEINFADLNGDGLPDMRQIVGTSSLADRIKAVVYINNGHGWSLPEDALDFLTDEKKYFRGPAGYSFPQFPDLDGDGVSDYVTIVEESTHEERVAICRPGDASCHIYKDKEYLSNGGAPDLLSGIVLPAGGKVSASYKSSAEYRDASRNPLNPELPLIVQTVSSITETDPVNNISGIKTYSYEGGTYFYDPANYLNRKFAGFGKITQADSMGNITASYYNTDSYHKAGQMYRQEIYGPDGRIYSADFYNWDADDLGNGRNFVFLASHLRQDINGEATHKDTAVSYEYDNSTGNLLSKKQWGEVAGNDSGTFSDIGNDAIFENFAYATDNANAKFKISDDILSDSSGNKLKETRNYYDDLPLGRLSEGNPTKQELWNGSGYISSSKTYNSTGMVLSETDYNGNIARYSYDQYNLYPSAITNALGQKTTLSYSYAAGKPSRTVDANGYVKETDYDALGRPVQERASDRKNVFAMQVRANYVYTDMPLATSVQTSVFTDNYNKIDSYAYFDGFGRQVQARAEFGDNASCADCYQASDTFYNSTGQVARQSAPYLSQGTSKTPAISDAALYTSFSYDPLYRQISASNTLGRVLTQYLNWQTTQTDQNNNKKDFIYDAYGNLAQVNEYNGEDVYATKYAYDLPGNLIGIIDALGNARNFIYDALGRRTGAEDLHSQSDADFGKYSYSYDSNGNIISKTDPNGTVISYAYDALNRKTFEKNQLPGKAQVLQAKYAYDACGKGFLCSVIQPAVNGSSAPSAVYAYFADGLVEKEIKNISAKSYATTYAYNLQGNQILSTQPNGDQIKYVYNSAGKLDQVLAKIGGASNFSAVVSGLAYAPNSRISSINFANNILQQNTFDPAKQYRLLRKTATDSAGKKLQDLNYAYDNVGNITSINNANYSYDNLYRLVSAPGQSFAYDAIGNILSDSQAGVYSYGLANPHAVVEINASKASASASLGKAEDSAGSLAPGDAPSSSTLLYSSVPATATLGSTFKISCNFGAALPCVAASSGAGKCVWAGWVNGSNATFNCTASSAGIQSNHCNTFAYAKDARCASATTNKIKDISVSSQNPALQSSSAPLTAVLGSTFPVSCTYNAANLPCASATSGGAGCTFTGFTNSGTTVNFDCNAKTAGNQANYCNTFVYAKDARCKTAQSKQIASTAVESSATVFAYDANGNLVLESGKKEVAYAYDSNNRLISATTKTSDGSVVSTYAYDYLGQRVYAKDLATTAGVKTSDTTYYPSGNYSEQWRNSGKAVKRTLHIFLPSGATGSQDLLAATIEYNLDASGKFISQTYYIIADHLSSTQVTTDQAGAVTELTDYEAYGKIKSNEHPPAPAGQAGSTFTEPRKYIGQYQDPTGLNYLNARYYNANYGRFITQDPMFWNFDQQWLQDPQTQNAYSYARNNPITGSDPTGQYTEITSKPIEIPILSFLTAHTSIHVVPEPGENLYMDANNVCRQITSPITFGGYPVGAPVLGWHLTVIGNEQTESAVYEQYLAGLPTSMVGVKVDAGREGMTNEQLDQNTINTYSSTPADQGYYNPTGTRRLTSFSNSNNTTTYFLQKSGVSDKQINQIGMNLFVQNLKVAPGFGTSLTAPNYLQTASQKIFSALSSAVQNITSALQMYNTK